MLRWRFRFRINRQVLQAAVFHVGDRALAERQRQKLDWKKRLIWLIFWIYMGTMVYFLFLGERYGNPYNDYHYNLILFQEIRRFIVYREHIGTFGFFVNIVGNIFAFSPFGMLLPILSVHVRRWWKMLALSFAVTMCIECTQLVTRLGVFDVDDLFMNTLGGMIGYGLYCMLQGIYKRIRRKKGEKEHGI